MGDQSPKYLLLTMTVVQFEIFFDFIVSEL